MLIPNVLLPTLNLAYTTFLKNFKRYLQFTFNKQITSPYQREKHSSVTKLNIIIKPADKGGKIVIKNPSDYLHEALHDIRFYSKLTQPRYLENVIKISNLVNQLYNLNFINNRQYSFLTPPSDPKPRLFYLLPKIHKNTIS